MEDAEKIVARVDELTPNQYTLDQKLYWIDQLEAKIDKELRQTHVIPEDEEMENPYSDDLYPYWLQAMIAQQNSEVGKYNQHITLFNAKYAEYCAYINRKYTPVHASPGNRFLF